MFDDETGRLKQLVLIGEQAHDRLTFGNALDRLCDQRCHGKLANFLTSLACFAQRNGVGHHHFVEGIAFGNTLDGRA